jgi:uncharacterized membrane protein YdbT with pleckstrin-like domain
MSFIEKNLMPNEKILFRTKKNFIIFLGPALWTLVCLFFLTNSNPMVQKVAFLPLIVALLTWINQGLIYYVSEFAITNVRVMMREGFFIRHTNDTRLAALANITVNQSLLGQVLNYGTVFINSFGGESDPFRDINNPTEFQKNLQTEIYNLQKSPL